MAKNDYVIKGKWRDTLFHKEGEPTADDLHIKGTHICNRSSTEYYVIDGELWKTYWCSPTFPGGPCGWLVDKATIRELAG